MLLRELRITSVYVTYDQTEAMSLGDRIENNQCSHFSGTVTASFILGDHTGLLVDVGQVQPIVVDRFARCTLKSGDRVRLSVNPAGLIVM